MAERAAKYTMGVQDIDQNIYRRNPLSTSIREQSRYPS